MKFIVFVLGLFLFACGKPSVEDVLDDVTHLAAYVDGMEHVMYVRPERQVAVLTSSGRRY
jgi:hypothetical protein